MEYGKWIAFAFLAGAVLVGFKSRQLKAYEFIVSGLFLLLLDRLVFHGQISDWIGQLGSKAKGAAAHGAFALPLLTPAARVKARRFGRRLWDHRPGWLDYVAYLAVVVVVHLWFAWSWLVSFLGYGLVLVGLTVVSALDTRYPDRPADAEEGTSEQVSADG